MTDNRGVGLWVHDLNYSAPTAHKLATKHQLGIDEVFEAVVQVEGLQYRWDDDPERGLRALVQVWIRKRRVLVVLYPTAQTDVFNLGSAYEV